MLASLSSEDESLAESPPIVRTNPLGIAFTRKQHQHQNQHQYQYRHRHHHHHHHHHHTFADYSQKQQAQQQQQQQQQKRSNGTLQKRRLHQFGGKRDKKVSAASNRVLPPQVANILEVTAIPVPRQRRARNFIRKQQQQQQQYQQQRYTSADSSGRSDDSVFERSPIRIKRRGSYLSEGSSNSRTYLDLLLSSPDDLEDDDTSLSGSNRSGGSGVGGGDGNGNGGRCADTFSLGSVSCGSVPSLERDDDGFDQCDSHAEETPPSLDRKVYTPKSTIQISEAQACSDDHPLLFGKDSLDGGADDDDLLLDDYTSAFMPQVQTTMTGAPAKRTSKQRSTFKSNLTASLRAIKLAAQSVSQFTAPSLRNDDFLTRSFSSFSMSSTDDRRPEPMHQPPSPALRRYLNPINLHAFSEFPRNYSSTNAADMTRAMPVQMKTYRRYTSHGTKPSPNLPTERLNQPNSFETADEPSQSSSSSSPSSSASSASASATATASLPAPPPPDSVPRQFRENGEFLRMIVLEMNMRRRGKLRLDSPGRARYMLPPKKGSLQFVPSVQYTSSESESKRQTPQRWVAFSVSY